ncbi:DEAD/DEAH box helicase [Actinocrinis puniceicyclus]|uniref:RNA helicase n=1 Tax=Actinocrinis puniceicyclus TaxID=977794 RepID=A0A8J7WLV4_9ACTN|nr:DEAD/DEAH box helicase [Actinocrinis puniceicyclus]
MPETVEALDALGITAPFPIQSATIPVALSGADVIGQAKTGTGKTLAFGIPLLQRVSGPDSQPLEQAEVATGETSAAAAPASGGSRRRRRTRTAAPAAGLTPAHGSPQALVVVPTRELAIQVTNDLLDAGKVRAIRVHALYGGRAYEPQVAALRAGIDIAVGTPGRLLDLTRQQHLELGGVRTLVLDEADEMLDLGFLPDVERIIAQLPADRQTMLFSATMRGEVISLARRYMSRPTHIRAADPADLGATVKNIAQFVYRAHSLDKVEMLARILQAEGRGLTIVFARTKRTVAKVAEELSDRHFAVAAVHGDLGQGAREQALRAFRNGKIDVLVATDVAARGIDVEGVTHVINFQCPEDEKVYTHRTGRTGRAGNKGTAVTFVDWDEVPRWQLINKALDLPYPEPAEIYSTSPQLYADLGIPEGVKGVLPRLERVRQGLEAEEIEDLGETGRSRSPRAGRKEPSSQERPPRTPRQRTRTRSRQGQKVGRSDEAAVEETTQDVAPPVAAPQSVVAQEVTEQKAPRKRTRTRKPATPTASESRIKLAPGSLAGPLEPARDPQPQPQPEASEAQAAQSVQSAPEAPAAQPRKRVRARKSAEPEAVAAAATGPVAAAEPEAVAQDAAAGPVANPRRTRVRAARSRKSAAAAAAEPITETPQAQQ